MTHTMRTRPVLGIVVASALLALTSCGGSDPAPDKGAAKDEPTSQESAKDEAEPAAPGLEDIPDVVAEVNGEEITKDEFATVYAAQFALATQQAEMTGQEPDEKALQEQAVAGLVDTELLTQDAETRGISVSDEEVDAELAALAEQFSMASTDELFAALKEQGTTVEQAREQVETQVMVEKIVIEDEGSIEPTEKELRTLYELAKKQQDDMGKQGGKQEKFPPFAEIKDKLAEQARSEKVNTAAQALLKKLREDADITINL